MHGFQITDYMETDRTWRSNQVLEWMKSEMSQVSVEAFGATPLNASSPELTPSDAARTSTSHVI